MTPAYSTPHLPRTTTLVLLLTLHWTHAFTTSLDPHVLHSSQTYHESAHPQYVFPTTLSAQSSETETPDLCTIVSDSDWNWQSPTTPSKEFSQISPQVFTEPFTAPWCAALTLALQILSPMRVDALTMPCGVSGHSSAASALHHVQELNTVGPVKMTSVSKTVPSTSTDHRPATQPSLVAFASTDPMTLSQPSGDSPFDNTYSLPLESAWKLWHSPSKDYPYVWTPKAAAVDSGSITPIVSSTKAGLNAATSTVGLTKSGLNVGTSKVSSIKKNSPVKIHTPGHAANCPCHQCSH